MISDILPSPTTSPPRPASPANTTESDGSSVSDDTDFGDAATRIWRIPSTRENALHSFVKRLLGGPAAEMEAQYHAQIQCGRPSFPIEQFATENDECRETNGEDLRGNLRGHLQDERLRDDRDVRIPSESTAGTSPTCWHNSRKVLEIVDLGLFSDMFNLDTHIYATSLSCGVDMGKIGMLDLF